MGLRSLCPRRVTRSGHSVTSHRLSRVPNSTPTAFGWSPLPSLDTTLLHADAPLSMNRGDPEHPCVQRALRTCPPILKTHERHRTIPPVKTCGPLPNGILHKRPGIPIPRTPTMQLMLAVRRNITRGAPDKTRCKPNAPGLLPGMPRRQTYLRNRAVGERQGAREPSEEKRRRKVRLGLSAQCPPTPREVDVEVAHVAIPSPRRG